MIPPDVSNDVAGLLLLLAVLCGGCEHQKRKPIEELCFQQNGEVICPPPRKIVTPQIDARKRKPKK